MYHTIQPPWESSLQGAEEEALAGLSSLRLRRGSLGFPLAVEQWNSGTAHHPLVFADGILGVCPFSLHVFCGSREGTQQPCFWFSRTGS